MSANASTDIKLPESQLLMALSNAFSYPAEGIRPTLTSLSEYATSKGAKWGDRAQEVVSLANSFDNLTAEQLAYTRLFIGSLKMEAPPYASYYLGEEQLLNGETAAEVEEIYSMFGLQLDNSEIAPADHIRYLLAFLALLAERNEETGDTAFAEAFADFRDEYVLSWFDECIELVDMYAEDDYYPALVEFIADVLKTDESLIGIKEL